MNIADALLAQAQPQAASAPFVWGQGGARLTPEEIARQRELAAVTGASDYSPVGHWAQGLGRVLDGLDAGLTSRRLGKAEAANAAESNAVLQALFRGEIGGQAELLAAANSPYLSEQVRGVAGGLIPKQEKTYEYQQLLQDAGYAPGTPEYQEQARRMAENRNNPFVTATLPGGRMFVGTQQDFQAMLSGGIPASGSVMPAPVGKLTPMEGGPSQPAAGGFLGN